MDCNFATSSRLLFMNQFLLPQGSPSAALDNLFEPLSPEEADFFDMPNDGANDEVCI